MSIESIASKVEKHVLKKTKRTAGEIAERAGFTSGRSIARALGLLKDQGHVVVHPGRYPTYTKVV